MVVVMLRYKWDDGWLGFEDECNKFEVDSVLNGKPMKLLEE
jgi:hypothetical protein